jgi:hypothetical protein
LLDCRPAVVGCVPDDERNEWRNRQQHQNEQALLDSERICEALESAHGEMELGENVHSLHGAF